MLTNYAIVGAMRPPPGVVPNFVDPENHLKETIISHIIVLIFVTLFVGLRVYTRRFITRQLSWDDCKARHVKCLESEC